MAADPYCKLITLGRGVGVNGEIAFPGSPQPPEIALNGAAITALLEKTIARRRGAWLTPPLRLLQHG